MMVLPAGVVHRGFALKMDISDDSRFRKIVVALPYSQLSQRTPDSKAKIS